MSFQTFKYSPTLLTLEEVETAYPNGFISERHGCYYFLDQDEELAYFIQYDNGKYESEVQYVDLDTLSDIERHECELIAAHIAMYSWYKLSVPVAELSTIGTQGTNPVYS